MTLFGNMVIADIIIIVKMRSYGVGCALIQAAGVFYEDDVMMEADNGVTRLQAMEWQ